jgi:flagellar hook-associated protein 1 FlgK
MTSLFASLNVALSGLQTTQTILNTTTRNITNAQTPGYVKRTQQAITNAVGGGGTLSGSITRQVDEALLNKLRQNTSDAAYQSAIADALTQINQLAGDPSQETSLSSQITALGDAFQALSTHPTDPGVVQNVINAAQTIVRNLNEQTTAVQNIQQSQTKVVQDAVPNINQDLQNIADLNVKILNADANHKDDTDLKDQRDDAVKDLSQYIGVHAFYDNQGVLNVYSSDYHVLATQYAEVVSLNPTTNTLSTATGALSNVNGSVGSALDIINNTAPTYLQQLDAIARNLVNGLSNQTVSASGTVTSGSNTASLSTVDNLYVGQLLNDPNFPANTRITAINGTTVTLSNNASGSGTSLTAIQVGIPLFNPVTPVGTPPYFSGHGGITVNPNVTATDLRVGNPPPPGTQPNDNQAAVAAHNFLLNGTTNYNLPPVLSGSLTFTQAFTNQTIAIGQQLSNAKTTLTNLQTFGTQISQAIASTSEVNLDSELSNMVVLQNLYASNARVVTTTQKMLDDLLGLVR